MQKYPRLLGVVALSLATLCSAAPKPDLDAALARWRDPDLPGGVIIAYVDAEGVTYATAGQFAPEDERPITPDTQFEIGSVTKVFTSLLLADSERAGKVSREDSAAKYLLPAGDPDTAKLAKITLLTLATHTSGLPRMPVNQPEADGPHPYATYDRARLVESLRLDGPAAPTGEAVAYSNFGAAVLGEALAAAWQRSYADLVATRIFKPLGLDHTSLNLTGTPEPAQFAPGFAGGRPSEHWTFAAMAPAGALLSSARDLAKFMQACLGYRDTPLRETLAETFKPQRQTSPAGHIGLAWMIVDDPKGPVWWHNGGTGGFRCFVGFSPAAHAGVVILTANSANNPDGLGLELLGATPVTKRPAVVAGARDYIGRFAFTPAFAIVVTERNSALFEQATGQSRLALKEKATDRFAVAGVAAEISFERDATGKIVALVLHQNGFDQRAPKEP